MALRYNLIGFNLQSEWQMMAMRSAVKRYETGKLVNRANCLIIETRVNYGGNIFTATMALWSGKRTTTISLAHHDGTNY